MSILSVQNLAKFYGAEEIFAEISFSIAHGDKIALVGPNGVGKTTLLRIIVGELVPSEGQVSMAKGLRLAYLPQKPKLVSERSVHDEMLNVFADLRREETALLELSECMAAAEDPEPIMARYARMQEHFERAGGYDYRSRIERVLSGLGFTADTYGWPISVLSGGQVTRILLARLLLQEPDLLVLDEPTNYLDLDALEWLEGYLADWPEALLVVSHDRRFLDRVVSRVWEMNYSELAQYRGNYTHYVQQRKERLERKRREYEQQQEHIAKTEAFIRRYKAGQRSREAKGRAKRLSRLERLESPKNERRMSLELSTDLRSGDEVLISDEGLTVGYRERPDAAADKVGEVHPLFDSGEILVQRGQCIAMIGPNGSGKTTLLRTILGDVPPLEGSLRIGASVRIGYLPQDQAWLDGDDTVLERVLSQSSFTVGEARDFLGRFLFSGDDVYKQTGDLSGGECSRLSLALLAIAGANFLILDEPTTHLDVVSQEVLQEVLADFSGTTLMVSHDRYLIDALVTHLWVIEDGQLNQYRGGYSDYRDGLSGNGDRQAQDGEEDDGDDASDWERRRRKQRARQLAERRREQAIAELEERIVEHERTLERLRREMAYASEQQDAERIEELGHKYRATEIALNEDLDEWEELASEHV